MSLSRIYYDGQLQLQAVITLDRQASQHLLRVMRLRCGDQCVVFNGQGGEYLAEVTAAERDAQLKLTQYVDVDRESSVYVHLGQGLSRGERMDYAIQKSVEVGVAEITPLFTERSQVRLTQDRIEKRLQHWQKVIISACEQSGRTKIPIMNAPCELTQWVSQLSSNEKFVCALDTETTPLLTAKTNDTALLIGPEGGLTQEEVDTAKSNGFKPVSLGKRTLRTETAAPVAIALLLAEGR